MRMVSGCKVENRASDKEVAQVVGDATKWMLKYVEIVLGLLGNAEVTVEQLSRGCWIVRGLVSYPDETSQGPHEIEMWLLRLFNVGDKELMQCCPAGNQEPQWILGRVKVVEKNSHRTLAVETYVRAQVAQPECGKLRDGYCFLVDVGMDWWGGVYIQREGLAVDDIHIRHCTGLWLRSWQFFDWYTFWVGLYQAGFIVRDRADNTQKPETD